MLPLKFTYPFRYVPHPLVLEAAQQLIADIDSSPELKAAFAEGKMLGVLVCSAPDGALVTLRAFSGLAAGRSTIPGFVPPIFDTLTIAELWGGESHNKASSDARPARVFGEDKYGKAERPKGDWGTA